MNYVTVEVAIDQGRILVREPEKLPAKGNGLLTFPEPPGPSVGELRPFGLARGQFVVPKDFNAALPEEVLQDFEGA